MSLEAVIGDLLAVVGGMAAAVYTAFGERARVADQHDRLHDDLLQRLRGAAARRLPGRSACTCTAIAPTTWLAIAGLVVGAQLLGHSMFNYALQPVSATTVSVLILLEVPGAALLAWLWLGQVPSLASRARAWRCCSSASSSSCWAAVGSGRPMAAGAVADDSRRKTA